MNKILPLFFAICFVFISNAQSVVKGIFPVSIASCYDHTSVSSWGSTPNLNTPGISFQDTLIMGNDGTPGTNNQGDPLAEEGCSPLINNVAGKIVVLFRGTCSFTIKAVNAQNAGAVGLIIVNLEDSIIEMGGSDPTITIPIVMIKHTDGLTLKTAMQNGDVDAYMGHNGFTGTIISSSNNTCGLYNSGYATVNCSYGPSPHTYEWSNSSTSDSIHSLDAGTYYVTSKDSLNCSVVDSVVISTFTPMSPALTIVASSTFFDCVIGTITLTTSQPGLTYSWTGAYTTDSIIINTCGLYTVHILDSNLCPSTDSIYISCSNLNTPEICFVSTDNLSIGNNVIWEKPTTGGIDSFYVYRSSTDSSYSYTKIGELNFIDTAIFYDNQINPNTQAYFYRITSVDTCGGETSLSDFHKTIYLSAIVNSNQQWDLSWTPYVGATLSGYDIYRGSSPQNLSLLTSLPASSTSFIDTLPPASGNVFYQVQAVNPIICNPLKNSTDLGTIKSNIPNSHTFSVETNEIEENLVVYPNPTKDKVNVEIPKFLNDVKIELFDFSGQLIQSVNSTEKQSTMDLQGLSNGIYYIKVKSDSYTGVTKIVKN